MPDRNSQHQHVDLGAVLADHDDSGHPMTHDDAPGFTSRAERRHHDAHSRRRRRRRGRRGVVLLIA
ncbi:MAG TPA: hypothetical protein VHO27_14985, partial [Angustibacter sp.]|nr:hypothetical protein [Angustibacter sp.]